MHRTRRQRPTDPLAGVDPNAGLDAIADHYNRVRSRAQAQPVAAPLTAVPQLPAPAGKR